MSAEGRTRVENKYGRDELKVGNNPYNWILVWTTVIVCFVVVRLVIPGLIPDTDIKADLNGPHNQNLQANREQLGEVEERFSWYSLVKLRVCGCKWLKDSKRDQRDQIFVDKSIVSHWFTDIVEHDDLKVLDHSVGYCKFSDLECCSKRGFTLTQQRRHALDIGNAAGEWCCYGGFSLTQRDAYISLLQSSAIIGTISAHADLLA